MPLPEGLVGRDGIHGATFSSLKLDEAVSSNVVQIGDPLTQKRLTEFVIEARDKELNAISDNGAGGLSSSVGETAEMSNVPEFNYIKFPKNVQTSSLLQSLKLAKNDTAVDPRKYDQLRSLASDHGAVYSNIENSPKLKPSAFYHNEMVALIPMQSSITETLNLNLAQDGQHR